MSDPSTLPLLTAADLAHLGAFRAPQVGSNGQDFGYGGAALAHNPATNTLYLSNLPQNVAEITIPAFGLGADPSKLPAASYVQPFGDPTDGHRAEIQADRLGSLVVVNGRLVGTAYRYYDADVPSQRSSHYARSLTLDEPSFRGWSAVWQAEKTGFVSGWMTPVPAEWQAALGGSMLTGNGCIPIVTRTSFGLAGFAFDPLAIGSPLIPASPLVYYTEEHATLGPWHGSNPTYGGSTEVGGMVIIPGTRTLLYFGRNGMGPYCYGDGVSIDPPPAGMCFDPTSASKGTHAYPYRYQIWAYDLNDLAAVKAGTKQPWEVVPYAVWPLTFPTPEPKVLIGGISYDAAKNVLYVTQMRGDDPSMWNGPLVHGYAVNISGTSVPAPTPIPTPTPVPAPIPTPTPVPTVDPKIAELEGRIATIKALVQQALNASKPNTAKAIVTPLKTAMTK